MFLFEYHTPVWDVNELWTGAISEFGAAEARKRYSDDDAESLQEAVAP